MRRDPRRSAEWKRLRARWAEAVRAGGVGCRRCGGPITPGQPWDLGHVVDLADGGAPLDAAPEHRACNRAAGGRRNRRPAPPPLRGW